MAIADASNWNSPCDGHPGASHLNGRGIDLLYYTHAESNVTQKYASAGPGVVKIWDADGLMADVFDWERNYVAWSAIRSIADVQFSVDERILEHMKAEITNRFGISDANTFTNFVFGDPPKKYNHHLHTHLTLK